MDRIYFFFPFLPENRLAHYRPPPERFDRGNRVLTAGLIDRRGRRPCLLLLMSVETERWVGARLEGCPTPMVAAASTVACVDAWVHGCVWGCVGVGVGVNVPEGPPEQRS